MSKISSSAGYYLKGIILTTTLTTKTTELLENPTIPFSHPESPFVTTNSSTFRTLAQQLERPVLLQDSTVTYWTLPKYNGFYLLIFLPGAGSPLAKDSQNILGKRVRGMQLAGFGLMIQRKGQKREMYDRIECQLVISGTANPLTTQHSYTILPC